MLFTLQKMIWYLAMPPAIWRGRAWRSRNGWVLPGGGFGESCEARLCGLGFLRGYYILGLTLCNAYALLSS